MSIYFPNGQSTILFLTPVGVTKFLGKLIRWGKTSLFRPTMPFISETVRDRQKITSDY